MVGYSPWGHKERNITEQASTHAQRLLRHPNELNKQAVCARESLAWKLSVPSPSSLLKPGNLCTSQAIEQKAAVKAWIPIIQAKVAQLTLQTFNVVTQTCKNGKEHKTDTQNIHVPFLGN